MTAPTPSTPSTESHHQISFEALVWRYPALDRIFAEAESTRDWTRLACLRADVRALHMSPGEESACLGLIADYAPVLIPVQRGEAA